jgi:hypothetical protein
MKNASIKFDMNHVDMVEIDKRARQLRADAIRNWINSFKVVLSGYGFGVSGRPSRA